MTNKTNNTNNTNIEMTNTTVTTDTTVETANTTNTTNTKKISVKANKPSINLSAVPQSRRDINLEYMVAFCKQDKEKAMWFCDLVKKYEGFNGSAQKRFGKMREDFVAQYYPSMNVKKSTYKSKLSKYSAEMESFLASFEDEAETVEG